MACLHENKEEFRNAVLFAADQNHLAPAAVEKELLCHTRPGRLEEAIPVHRVQGWDFFIKMP